MHFELTSTSIDPSPLRLALLHRAAGAYCSYEGWVRDHNIGRPVQQLEYSSYAQLAPTVGEQLLLEAQQKFAIEAAALVHRVGCLQIGDLAVWVGVTAPHRAASFSACRYLIDQAKSRLPIWKKEHYRDGSSAWISNHSHRTAEAATTANTPSNSSTHAQL